MYLGGVSTPPKFGSELPGPKGPGFGSLDEKAQQIAKSSYLRAFLIMQMPSESCLKQAIPREHVQFYGQNPLQWRINSPSFGV